MTGRAAGSCAGDPAFGTRNAGWRGCGFGFGGRGRGFRGRGRGWGFAAGYPVGPVPMQAPTPAQERTSLKQQADLMQNKLNQIHERIEQLEK
jgi:hypothetical protein